MERWGNPAKDYLMYVLGQDISFVYGSPDLGCTSFSQKTPPESPLLMHPPLVSLDQPGTQPLGSLHEKSHSPDPFPEPPQALRAHLIGQPFKTLSFVDSF